MAQIHIRQPLRPHLHLRDIELQHIPREILRRQTLVLTKQERYVPFESVPRRVDEREVCIPQLPRDFVRKPIIGQVEEEILLSEIGERFRDLSGDLVPVETEADEIGELGVRRRDWDGEFVELVEG